MSYDFDLFVIGAGSGGVRASRVAAGLGARVGIAESLYLGGTCVNVGCVPKKLFVYGSHFAEDFADAANYGWSVGNASFDWPTLRENKNKEIERLNSVYAGLLDGSGVTLYDAHATLVDPHTVDLGGQRVSAERILVATGSWPFVPDFPGREHVITSNEAFHMPSFPKRAVVVGGGYIAVEFAGIFSGLGAETHLLYRGPMFLRGFDDGVRRFVADELREKGIHLHFDTEVEHISAANAGQADAGEKTVTLKGGEVLTADTVLYATGRRAKTDNLGLEEAGVELKANGAIVVDDYFQTSVPNIYAIGDVIDRMQLTPVAISEGILFAHNVFGGGDKAAHDYDAVATAVFCQPNIGTVGPTEEEARAAYDIDVFEAIFRPMKHTVSGRQERTLLKLIVRKSDDVVVAVHMVGPEAGEIVQSLGVAVKAGATKAQFDATMAVHPTTAEEFVTMREVTR